MIGSDPTFTVSEFVSVFNQSLELMYPSVMITGEIANFRISKNKWVYFDLKDEYASVKFFGHVFALPGPLEDGLTVEVIGKPRLHPQFGFSVNYDRVRAVGEGSIKKAQDLLARKLEAEGLFAAERKRPLLYPPERIALVTSAESAAFSDFQKILRARWPFVEVSLYDSLVQGAEAPVNLVNAIRAANEDPNPSEILVIIRGGGSADDLAAFSDEVVVRAVASSRIPTIVAIGHEKDVSLVELAADLRASTPSNAAELLVPSKTEVERALSHAEKALDASLAHLVQAQSTYIKQAATDAHRLMNDVVAREKTHVESLSRLHSLLDPMLPLKKGYALVRNKQGKMIKSVRKIAVQNRISVELTDGKLQTRVESIE